MMNTMQTALGRPFPALPPAWMEESDWERPEQIRPAFQSVLPPARDTAAQLQEHLVRHYAQLHQRMSRRLGGADLAAECLHDTWLRLARPVEGAVDNADAYVFRMLCHVATDRLRSQRPSVSLDDPDNGCPELSDELPGPHAVAEARSSLAALSRAMQGLSRRQRAVLVALRVEERSRGDVSRWLGISLRSVDTALRQALAHCSAECDMH
ncbi:RNA polymerase sigma factor [Variovorax sp.]|uniref:RNA polymerase sigma factor n=1 Tax=Variovorax sp. TaxID=1871043 RepID=UPI0037DA541C